MFSEKTQAKYPEYEKPSYQTKSTSPQKTENNDAYLEESRKLKVKRF